MSEPSLWAVEWRRGDETLTAIEPSADEVRRAAPALAAYYNDAHNRRMMAHEDDPFDAADVVAYYHQLRDGGGRPFLLQREGVLLGDADFRHPEAATAEFAIMIGDRATQGRGLGTRFGLMLHAFGFQVLGLERVYISVIPANAPSRALFQRLGYQVDDSPVARALIDDASDVTLSLARPSFVEAWRVETAAIRCFPRPQAS
ncbi:MAG TPA: GNAT family N-acetyltransferase [Polyangia bacterium]|nr:GNAT family N-acetyltransferase [Polyangia bacterium]